VDAFLARAIQCVELIAVDTLDDLAAAILGTPRYGDEADYDRDPLRLREALHAREAELCTLRDEFGRAKEVWTHETRRLEFRAASLHKQLRAAEEKKVAAANAAAEGLQRELESLRHEEEDLRRLLKVRENEISVLKESTSWRVTAPMRALKSAFIQRGAQ
jgi:hypothetical protein